MIIIIINWNLTLSRGYTFFFAILSRWSFPVFNNASALPNGIKWLHSPSYLLLLVDHYFSVFLWRLIVFWDSYHQPKPCFTHLCSLITVLPSLKTGDASVFSSILNPVRILTDFMCMWTSHPLQLPAFCTSSFTECLFSVISRELWSPKCQYATLRLQPPFKISSFTKGSWAFSFAVPPLLSASSFIEETEDTMWKQPYFPSITPWNWGICLSTTWLKGRGAMAPSWSSLTCHLCF